MQNELKSKIVAKRNLIDGFEIGGIASVTTSQGINSKPNSSVVNYVTLTNYDLSGAETVDGASPSNNDRILVANQTDPKQNGLYAYNSTGAWTRIAGISGGNIFTVLGGNTKKGTVWIIETSTFSIGTDNISIIEHAISRKDNSFSGFDSVGTLATSDIGLVEVSDGTIKKFQVNDILGLINAGSEIDNTGDTLFVSPNYTAGGRYYTDIDDAIADVTVAGTLIIVFPGTYTGNYDNTGGFACTLHFMKGAVLNPTNKSLPALSLGASTAVTGHLRANYEPTSGYIIEISSGWNSLFEADYIIPSILGNNNAIKITNGNNPLATIKVGMCGDINVVSGGSHKFHIGFLQGMFKQANSGAGVNYLEADYIGFGLQLTGGTLIARTKEIIGNIAGAAAIEVSGGYLHFEGLIRNYAGATTNGVPANYPIYVHTLGNMTLINSQVKNSLGGCIFVDNNQTVRLQNCAIQTGSVGGGIFAPAIDTAIAGNVIYNGLTTMSAAPTVLVVTNIVANQVVDPLVSIL